MSNLSAPVLFSAAEQFLDSAAVELRNAFPDATLTRIGPDLGEIVADGLSIADVAERAESMIFVRHLLRQVGSCAIADIGHEGVSIWRDLPLQSTVALQVWTSGADGSVRPDDLRKQLQQQLEEAGITVKRSGCEQVLSLVITGNSALLGFNSRSNALSDWPGGRVRLAKPREQISRSEFKLEELLREYPLALPEGGKALDLGASPGGWTRILRSYNFEVWSVDPGDMHDRVRTDPEVHHIRTTAMPFIESSREHFDLIVNDMRMDPMLSCQLMLNAAKLLKPGGLIVQTLKLPSHDALDLVDRARMLLDRWYGIERIVHLHHNRNEVTVVAGKRIGHLSGESGRVK